MMTSAGRGRGWGSIQDKGVPLRRPGEASTPVEIVDMEVECLIAAVQCVSLQDANESVVTLHTVEELLKNQCQTAEKLRMVVQRLHDRSLEDRQFGLKAAAAYGYLANWEVEEVKLRNVLLMSVQKDFQDRAHLQTACNSKFLNAIALLGEIFHQVRLADGSPIGVLASAVLQYQDMLLAGEEHELELFTTQLAVNGRKLYDLRATELEELMHRVRTTLMSRNLSGQCRCWLLVALDLAANRYAPLSGQLQAFYQVHLGASAITQLQRLQIGLKVDTSSNTTQNHVVEPKSPEKSGAGGEAAEGILAPVKSPDAVVNGTAPVPFRPTGRTGSGSKKPEQGAKSKKSTDEPGRWKSWNQKKHDGDDIWGTSRGEKSDSWGHDDRFVKDDDFYGKQSHRGEGSARPKNKENSNWRERKGSEGKEQRSILKTQKSDPGKQPQEPKTAPPPVTEEESWD